MFASPQARVSRWDKYTHSGLKTVAVLSIWLATVTQTGSLPYMPATPQSPLIWLSCLPTPGHYLLSSLGFTIAL